MNDILLAFTLSLALVFIAIWKRSLTKMGYLIAFICAFLICLFGSYKSFIILTVFYILLIGTDKLSKNEYQSLEKSNEDISDRRTYKQVLANIGLGTLSLIIFKITNNAIFHIAFVVCLAAALADSMSSNIGILSNEQPINIFRFKKGAKGLSGNVTILGLFGGLLGSSLMAILYILLYGYSLNVMLIISLVGFSGSLFDTFLGTFFEAKYKCTYCGNIVETRRHCNQQAMLIKGYKIFENNMVNFLSNLFCFIISLFILK